MSRRVPFGLVQKIFGRAPTPQQEDPYERLAHRFDDLDRALAAIASREQPAPVQLDGQRDEGIDALQQGLAAIEKQLQRAGREQLKANALIEAQQEQARATLETLEAQLARRDEELDRLRAQLAAREEAARLEVVRQLLPALDGIAEALRAGEDVLGQPVATMRQPTLFERMRARIPTPSPEEMRLRGALRSWLHGLTFVRQRLLDLLAAEGVRPIEALHAPFDPTLHIALEAVPASDEAPSGTVVAVLRGGYTVGERVLRHAEVAVAAEQEREAP